MVSEPSFLSSNYLVINIVSIILTEETPKISMNPEPCPRCNAYREIFQNLAEQRENFHDFLQWHGTNLEMNVRRGESNDVILQQDIDNIRYYKAQIRKIADYIAAIKCIQEDIHPNHD